MTVGTSTSDCCHGISYCTTGDEADQAKQGVQRDALGKHVAGSQGAYCSGGHHRLQLIKLLIKARGQLVKVGVDGVLDHAYGVVSSEVQVGPDLGEDVLGDIVGRMAGQHLYTRTLSVGGHLSWKLGHCRG